VTDPTDLVDVVLIDLPVEQFRRSQQYHDALLRELALIDSGSSTEADSTPRRLIELVERVGRQYGGFSVEPQSQLREALERHVPRVDVSYRIPRSTAKASLELGRLLDEVDEYCRRGELLTTAAPDEVVAFRRRYLDEIVRQIGGAAPRPWPDA
jgi:hypothetical protein